MVQDEAEKEVRRGIRKKQKLFSTKSLPIALAIMVFTGLIVVMPLTPVVVFVFAANIDGTSGNDTLNGTPDPDTISGFEGNDIISGEGGDDTLDGGKGDDEIRGGDGNDGIKDGNDEDYQISQIDYGNKVYGGSGADNIDVGIDYLRSDFYYVYGEDGADYIEVVSNADIKGGIDDDTIYCTGFECTINGDEGNDEIHVQLYDVGSSVYGGSGNDKVFGKGYYVSGDGGNDYLSLDSVLDLKGGEGDDILEVLNPSYETYYNGGLGADSFNCSPGPGDIVEDYNPGEGDTVSADCETVEGTTQPPEDTTAPDVEITEAVDTKGRAIEDGSTTNMRYIEITFEATDAVGIDKTECSLDGQPFTPCTSPVVYDRLSRSTHEFTVRATDAAGNTGEDEFTWTIRDLSSRAPGRQ